MMYGSWDMKRNRQVFVILGHFLPFYPTNNPKNQNFEKKKWKKQKQNKNKKNKTKQNKTTWRYHLFTKVYQK